jgi:uncharacterized membrane protein YphA (DoxX/SURF4 family)
MSERKRPLVVTILSGLAALAFLASGGFKLTGSEEAIANFERFGFGAGFMYFIGAAEVAGAIGLFLPRLAPVAAGGLTLVMAGAASMHIQNDPLAQAVPALVLLVICAYLTYARRGELTGA